MSLLLINICFINSCRPSMDTHIPSLRLIDFGCAIDMTLFKEGQEFRKVKLDDFKVNSID